MLNNPTNNKSAENLYNEANEILSADDLANVVTTSIDKRLAGLRNYLENGDTGEVVIKAQIRELKMIRGLILQVIKKKENAIRAFLELTMGKGEELS